MAETYAAEQVADAAALIASHPDAVVIASSTPTPLGLLRAAVAARIPAWAALDDDGSLGWLTTVRCSTMDPAPPPAAYIAGSGGIFRDCAIHDFDAVRWVTGREVVEVYAVGDPRGDAMFPDAKDVSTTSTLLTFDDGTVGIFMHRFAEAFRIELGTFVDVAAGRAESPCTVRDGLEASWIAEAATLSLNEHPPSDSTN